MVPIFRNLFLLYLMSHRTVILAISLNLAFKGEKKILIEINFPD